MSGTYVVIRQLLRNYDDEKDNLEGERGIIIARFELRSHAEMFVKALKRDYAARNQTDYWFWVQLEYKGEDQGKLGEPYTYDSMFWQNVRKRWANERGINEGKA